MQEIASQNGHRGTKGALTRRPDIRREVSRADAIWRMFTVDQMSQREIATHFHISRQRVSQIIGEVREQMAVPTRKDIILARLELAQDHVRELHQRCREPGMSHKNRMLAEQQLRGWLEREARYLGLDAPRLAATVSEDGQTIHYTLDFGGDISDLT